MQKPVIGYKIIKPMLRVLLRLFPNIDRSCSCKSLDVRREPEGTAPHATPSTSDSDNGVMRSLICKSGAESCECDIAQHPNSHPDLENIQRSVLLEFSTVNPNQCTGRSKWSETTHAPSNRLRIFRQSISLDISLMWYTAIVPRQLTRFAMSVSIFCIVRAANSPTRLSLITAEAGT